MNNNRDRNYRRPLRYHQGTTEYQVRIPRRRNWWWLLLLLLLLLLVQCQRTIEVTTLDALTLDPVEDVDVTLDYTAHYLYRGGFFTSENIHRELQTYTDGKAVFGGLPCTVFSYIFYTFSRVHITASSPCYIAQADDRLFHWTSSVEFRLERLLKDLILTVVDKETAEPLVNASVVLTYNLTGTMDKDSLVTDANGRVHIPQFWECGVINEIHGSCYGYADTLKTDVPARELFEIGPASTLKLRPLKQSFDYFVHNVETGEPIPMAMATVTLTNPDKRTTRGTTRTNVDGKGRGFYDDGFVLANVAIEASKQHYYDSVLVGDYTVEQFVKLPKEKRTVWLRPMPYVVEFQNVDSITGDPIAGVTNKIKVTDPTGTVETFEEISNTNGKFSLKAKEGSKVEIISSKDEEYQTKETVIDSFKEGEKIPMRPLMLCSEVDIVFCIDNTASMMGNIAVVKENAKSFHKDLTDYCHKHKRQIERMRLKVVSFGDLNEAPFVESDMYEMPAEQASFNSFLQDMMMTNGGDPQEDGLEALAVAIKNTPWSEVKDRTRQIIILYTDAGAHMLHLEYMYKKFAPKDMPESMAELKALWDTMDPVSRRLVLFAPKCTFWNDISSDWDGVFHRQFSYALPYNDILEAICNSL